MPRLTRCFQSFRCLSMFALLPLIACGDSTKLAGPTGAIHKNIVPNNAILVDSAWNTYASDVTITMTRFDSAGRKLNKRFIPVVYHIERSMDAKGRWHAVQTFPSRVRGFVDPGPGKFTPEQVEIARIEDDGDGSPLREFTALGKRIALPSQSSSTQASGTHGAKPLLIPLFDRTWVRSSIVPPALAAQRNNAFAAKFGAPTRTAHGLDQYTSTRGTVSRVFSVDPSNGAVVDVVTSRAGQATDHRSISYSKNSDGSAVRTAVVTEQFLTVPRKSRIVTEIRYANTHLENRN